MTRKFFGTDGIRGRTNAAPMTAEIAMKVGMAAGTYFMRGDHRHRVVIGKDTRLSGYMVENALVAVVRHRQSGCLHARCAPISAS
jgi:phosphoglucosamine mutase